MRSKRSLKAAAGAVLLAGATALALAGTAPAHAATAASGNFTGTLANGTTWVADVPANWNGTLLLYSHGFGPLTAADAPDPGTQAALLARGYALAGVLRPERLGVGTRHRRQRPVRHARGRRGHRAAAPAEPGAGVRHVDGRPGQRA